MSQPGRRAESADSDHDDPNPYLQPTSPRLSRSVGLVLLCAMLGTSALIAFLVMPLFGPPAARAPFTSSMLIILLVLLVMWGFCWQAGWRLLLGRSDHPGSLFSWPVWLAIGVMLLTLTSLVAAIKVRDDSIGDLDVYMLLSMSGLGGWCLWLAWQGWLR